MLLADRDGANKLRATLAAPDLKQYAEDQHKLADRLAVEDGIRPGVIENLRKQASEALEMLGSPDHDPRGTWHVSGGIGELQERFTLCAADAACAAGFVPKQAPANHGLQVWLRLLAANIGSYAKVDGEWGEVRLLCEASALMCRQFAADAAVVPIHNGATGTPLKRTARNNATLAKNLSGLRSLSGVTVDALANRTSINRKGILEHAKGKRRPEPETLATYSVAFSELLNRTITVVDLDSPQLLDRIQEASA